MSTPTLSLWLQDGQANHRIEDVVSLMAGDTSGQFGILPQHADLITVLEPGLFRYRQAEQPAQWRYGASTGGVLYCQRQGGTTVVRIVSRRFLLDEQPDALLTALSSMLEAEASLRVSTRDQVGKLDLALYKRMQELAQSPS